MIPGAATLRVGESVHDLCHTTRRWWLIDDRPYDRCRDYRCAGDRSCGCDWVIAASAAIVAAATVVVAVDVDIAIDVYVLIDVYVSVDVGVLVHVSVSVDVLVGVAVLIGVGGVGAVLVSGARVGTVLAGAGVTAIDTGLRAAPWLATATRGTTAAATTSSALSKKCHSRNEDGDGEYAEDLS